MTNRIFLNQLGIAREINIKYGGFNSGITDRDRQTFWDFHHLEPM